MPKRAYISMSEIQMPSFKAAKNCESALMWQCFETHDQDGLMCKAANTHHIKEENENFLPVYWQSNKEAGVTTTIFLGHTSVAFQK